MSLVLHSGAHGASLDQVAAVPTPDPTDTWTPLPHMVLIEEIKAALMRRHFAIANEQYGMWRGGLRLFGTMDITNGDGALPDHALQIGLRNSHDQSFSASGLIGSRVFVCDNLAFSGEVTFRRKHTSRMLLDLPNVVDRAVERLIMVRGWQEFRIGAYKQAALPREAVVHDLLVRAVDREIIPVSYLPKVLAEWRTPSFDDFAERTVWSLFNAFTFALAKAPSQIPERTIRLHALLDGELGLERPNPNEVIEEEAEVIAIEDAEEAVA